MAVCKGRLGVAEIRSRFVMAGSVRTHYSESGEDGSVILGLHGGGAGSSGLAGMGPVMPSLSKQFRYIAPDSIGGYGETDVSASTSRGLQSRVDHLTDFVNALCLDKFSIMGNSQGAWCAARYALLNPERIEKMVLLASATIVSAMGIKHPRSPGMQVLAAYDGTRERMRDLLSVLVANKSTVTDELVDLRQASATRPGAFDAFKQFFKNNSVFQSQLPHSLNFDMKATLPALTKAIPTVFIWGENDEFATPEAGHELEAMLPEVKFHWVADAGHQVQTDQPHIVASLIEEFIRKPAKVRSTAA